MQTRRAVGLFATRPSGHLRPWMTCDPFGHLRPEIGSLATRQLWVEWGGMIALAVTGTLQHR